MAEATLTFGDGNRISYEDAGEGSTVVLLHGSPGTARAWEPVAERLKGRFRLVAPDLLGYGGTDPRPDKETPHTADVAAYIEALIGQVGAPVLLVGHSYGGNVALEVALGGSASVKGLVLLEPVAMRVLPAVGEAAMFRDTKAIFDDYIESFEDGDARAVRKMIDFWFGADAFEAMPAPLQGFLMSQTARNVLDVKSSFNEAHDRAALRQVSAPVLVVYGGRSPEVVQRIASAISENVSDGTLQKLEGANHGMTTTHAAAVADLIAAHADRCL